MMVLGLGLSRLNYFVSLRQEYKWSLTFQGKYLKYMIKDNKRESKIFLDSYFYNTPI